VKYRIFISIVLAETLLLAILFWYGVGHADLYDRAHKESRLIVSSLQLTDLSIWTEARYTRHPSQADIFAPFQDFPSSLEHFPAGSIIAPHREKDTY